MNKIIILCTWFITAYDIAQNENTQTPIFKKDMGGCELYLILNNAEACLTNWFYSLMVIYTTLAKVYPSSNNQFIGNPKGIY
jgi:hypothetical protein